MAHETPIHVAAWLVGALGIVAVAAGQATPPGQGPLLSSAEADEVEVGPNVGVQPRRAWDAANPPATAEGEDGTEPGLEEEGEESRFHLWLGVDFTTAYCSRGFIWEDSGLIVQPWADAWLDVWRGEAATVSLTVGTWSSLHGQATDAGTDDGFRKHWYEADVYVGAALAVANWSLEGRYCWYTSPSDAWGTIEEAYLSAAYDDSECLGAWALQPTMILAIETGDNANDGGRNGTYLQLGIEPGFEVEDGALAGVGVSFPVSVGLSLSNYYEDGEGANDAFGFVSVGASVAVPLSGEGGMLGLDGSWGAWALTAGVQVVFLGDVPASFNGDQDAEVIGTMGIGVEF